MSKTYGRMHAWAVVALFFVVVLLPGAAAAVPSGYGRFRSEVAIDLHVSARPLPFRLSVEWKPPGYGRDDAERVLWSNRSVALRGRGVGLGRSIDGIPGSRGWKIGLTMIRLRLHGITLLDVEVAEHMSDGSLDVPRASALGVAALDSGRVVAPGKPRAPTHPMPEPGGALLFATGLGLVATWSRSARQR